MADLDMVRRIAAADHHLAVVTTTREDGTVQASVVNAGVLSDPVTTEPVVAFVAMGGSHKLRLLRQTGRATVVFKSGWEWVAVDGPVRLVGPADPLEEATTVDVARMLRDVFVAAGGEHEDWDEFDQVMAEEGRTAVYVKPIRITGND